MTNLDNIPKQSLFNGTLESPINSVQTTGIIVKPLIDFNPSPGEVYRLSILNPDGAEIISFEDQNPSGELTTVTRGLELADGVAGVGRAHGAGIRVTLSNPFQLYEDIQTAINSKADILSPTIDEPTFTDWVKLPSYANAAARDAAITVPAKDMAVILDNDGDGKRCLTLYSGSAWINITLPGRNVTIDGFLIVAGGYVKFPVYADNTARDAAILTPAQSMVIYNISAVTLQLYDGANWIDLDIGTPVPLATTSTPGRVRLATDQQVIDGTNDVGGEPLVVQPSQLGLKNVIEAILEQDMVAGTAVGVCPFISESDCYVDKRNPIPAFLTANGVDTVRAVTVLDSSRFAVLYTPNPGTTSLIVCDYDFSTGVTTYGSPTVIANAGNMCLIDTDKIAVVAGSGTSISITIATISTLAISLGTPVTFAIPSSLGANISNGLKIDKLGVDKGVVFYVPSTTSDAGAVVFTVSGTVPTFGTAVQPASNLRSLSTQVIQLDTDKFILTNSVSTTGRTDVATVSGTAITFTGEQTFTTGGSVQNARSMFLSTNKILTGYGNASGNLCFIVINVPSTTITPVTEFDTGLAANNQCFLALKTATSFYYNVLGTGFVVRYKASIDGSDIITGEPITSGISSNVLDSTASSPITNFVLNDRVFKITTVSTNDASIFKETDVYTIVGQLLNSGTRGETKRVLLKTPAIGGQTNIKGGAFYDSNLNIIDGDLVLSYNQLLGIKDDTVLPM